ncbi:MAG TPA: geranyl transferase, partial [Denitromonas sp.]|nr:geranyl transferase [Denitromonas sp.]HQV15860.1 geranyl transferase [Denitromonas sp.]
MSGTHFSDWMRAIQTRTETALANALPPLDLTPDRLHEAMRYAVLGGG